MSEQSVQLIAVRPPVTSDKPSWSDLWAQYNAFYGRIGDTAPTARGFGVARSLIDGVKTMCEARNVMDVYWHTQSDNAAARLLYDRLAQNTGFVVYRMRISP
ncbi:MAG: GNAT family N-acetyltransferase [Pseudomonadota bacterium]